MFLIRDLNSMQHDATDDVYFSHEANGLLVDINDVLIIVKQLDMCRWIGTNLFPEKNHRFMKVRCPTQLN